SRLEFSYSSSWRGGTGKLNRRSRGGGKSGNPAAVAGFPSAVGKSRLWTFPRSGVFHGPFTHKLCSRSENMNIERGLLWNQENAISRGLQLNQAIGKYLTASLSFTDGFYSNRYTWLMGSLTYI